MSFDVQFSFSYGRCTLKVAAADQEFCWRAYHLHRSFDHLLGVVAHLVEGSETCCSCRWVGGELSGGVFLDFVADPGDGINVAVHEFRYDSTATEYQEMWSAVRGRSLWAARIPRNEFLLAFATAVRRAEVLYADETGYMEHWGWSFPHAAGARIAAVAARAGQMPEPTSAIRNPPPPR